MLKCCAGCFRTFPPEVIHRGRGRCPDCAKAMQRAYDARRPSGWKRYGPAYRANRARLLAAHPFCSAPGCGATTNLEVDHIRPRSQGGTDELANLRVLCRAHNRRRPRGATTRTDSPVQPDTNPLVG